MTKIPLDTPQLHIAATMHRGNNPDQQDAMWLVGTSFQSDNLPLQSMDCTGGLFAIADGVANSSMPARASLLAVKALATALKAHPEWSVYDGLLGARHVRAAQTALCDAFAAGRLAWGSATTLVAAQIENGRVAVVNSGDSRAYLIRADGEVRQLSRDHTLLQQMIDRGEAEPGVEYARMYYALGDCLVADQEMDDFAVHRKVVELHSGDRLILCSDGVHDEVNVESWLTAMAGELDPLKMVGITRQAVFERGAADNFSIIALVFEVQP